VRTITTGMIIRCVALASLGALLASCREGVLDPQGPIGKAELVILYDATAIMLAVIVPVILLIIGFAWWFRADNPRARYLPNWAYSGRIEMIVWWIPALVIIFLGGIAWIGAHDLDPETQILLGGDNGLRGYPLRYQSGSGRALVTLEHRVYTDWYPFRLVRIGGAVFIDAGRTWGRGPVPVENKGWLADAGFGLRFGMSRSGLGNILHVDVAFPLNSEPGVDDVQFQVETKRTF